jgi:hypothetical protein
MTNIETSITMTDLPFFCVCLHFIISELDVRSLFLLCNCYFIRARTIIFLVILWHIQAGWLTDRPTSWSGVLLEKPPVAERLKNFPIFYGTWVSFPFSQELSMVTILGKINAVHTTPSCSPRSVLILSSNLLAVSSVSLAHQNLVSGSTSPRACYMLSSHTPSLHYATSSLFSPNILPSNALIHP